MLSYCGNTLTTADSVQQSLENETIHMSYRLVQTGVSHTRHIAHWLATTQLTKHVNKLRTIRDIAH